MSEPRFLPEEIAARYARGPGKSPVQAPGQSPVQAPGQSTARVAAEFVTYGGLSRRQFVKVSALAGGGLLLTISLPGCGRERGEAAADGILRGARPADGSPAPEGAWEPSAWVRINPDNTSTITVAKSEMGQGVRTMLALIVAEELDLDWEAVRVTQAPADDRTYGFQGTGGSTSVRSSWEMLREAGATARAMLVAAAAEELGAPQGELETRDSHVVHTSTGRKLAYGELAAAAARQEIAETVTPKRPDEWRLLGTEVASVDLDDIVTGRALYGIDVRMPRMLYAAVARTPVHGGRVRRYDASKALAVPGVKRVVDVPAVGNGTNVHAGVAVVAENSWAAIRGRDALQIEWDPGPGGLDSSEAYSERMREAVTRPGNVLVNRLGDPDRVIAETAAESDAEDHVVTATFEVPFISHATMEPQNSTAHVTGDRCVIRSPAQFPNWAAGAAAEALGIPRDNVELTVTLLGGGYGRRINPDAPVEAALVARELDRPVQVIWTREDDMRHDFYRPPAVHRLEAVLGPDGYPLAWRQRFCTPAIDGSYAREVDEERFGVGESDGGGNMFYRVPNRSCEYSYLPSHITRGWWRAVHTTHNTFAVEVFLDELAERAGIDPVEYRLNLIGPLEVERPTFPDDFPAEPERLKGVVRLAAEKAGWGRALPAGHGIGIACGIDHLSYAAEVIEVSVKGGELAIERVVCAADCGPVLNPNGARAQIEGAIHQGLSAALGERLTVQEGAIEQGNFDRYPVLRIGQAPRAIEVVFAETDAHPTGLGEPGLPPAAPALANAIYAATGTRYRMLPIRL